ncbi:MAG: hypothetical protein QNJ72_36350 [Pleurocapsa sp. MO_226.B13]|nr:hypothetical protein [Pleurocapsa sp. MO_226.B13]
MLKNMLNRLRSRAKSTVFTGIVAACLSTTLAMPASSQILPEVWGTVGSVDDLVSYGAGVRFAGTGLEVGTGEEGATGADFLTFISLPVVSPYLGIGYYSGDENVAYSGGIHISAGRFLVIGGGYHSVRGVNGKLGFKF